MQPVGDLLLPCNTFRMLVLFSFCLSLGDIIIPEFQITDRNCLNLGKNCTSKKGHKCVKNVLLLSNTRNRSPF